MKKKIILGTFILGFLLVSTSHVYIVKAKFNQNANDIKPNIVQTNNYNKVIETKNGKQLVTLQLKIKNKKALENYKNEQYNFLIESYPKDKLDTKKSEDYPITLTFSKNISVDELEKFLSTYNVTLLDYETKYVNEKGEWITGALTILDQNKINYIHDSILKNSKAKELTYKGITSARIKAQLTPANYKKISADKLIYLADISDFIIKNEMNSNTVKVRVPDIAWDKENIEKN